MINFKPVNENIGILLEHFGIKDYKDLGNRIVSSCPIHGGDNQNAFSFFKDDGRFVANWKCFTHECHTKFSPNTLGLVKGLLSTRKLSNDNKDAIRLLKSLYNLTDGAGPSFRIDPLFRIQPERQKEVKDIVRPIVTVPSEYFLGRGFKAETLERFEVGDCRDYKSKMVNRAVVPFFKGGRYVGCAGRSLSKKCESCNGYHDGECTDITERYSKWKNSDDLDADNLLYNFWNAQEAINATRTAIAVEGQGDVWKLIEAGYENTIGKIGVSFKEGQRNLLYQCVISNLIIIADPGNAGADSLVKDKRQLSRMFNIYDITLDTDPGSTDINTLRRTLDPIIERLI